MSSPYLMLLTDVQDEFLKTIKGHPSDFERQITPMLNLSGEECLDIYRRGYVARLAEALGETFEATWWVLGDEDFFKLAGEYIKSTPSTEYDLSEYGINFPSFLAAQPQSEEIPFISDLARFELTFQDVFHSANVEPTNLILSSQQILSQSRLAMSPSAKLYQSPYDIYQIWKRRHGQVDTISELEIDTITRIIIYKKSSNVLVHQLQIDEYVTLEALCDSGMVEKSIEVLVREFPQITPNRAQEIFEMIASMGVLTSHES